MESPSSNKNSCVTGEFKLIQRLLANIPDESFCGVVVGPGDDCGVVRTADGRLTLHTTDTLVAGVHFIPGQMEWRDIGWKVMAVNLSDIAAMGGSPSHAMVTVGIPANFELRDLEETYKGIGDACTAYGTRIIGGDVVRSSTLFITVAMTGIAGKHKKGNHALMLRSAASAEDVIAVTGDLGSSAGGQRAFAAGRMGAETSYVRKRHSRPEARIAEGLKMVEIGVLAAIDISDGTVADLRHVCEESGLAAVIDADKVPVSDELKKLFPKDWLAMGMSGGEDYELLFTSSPQIAAEAESAIRSPVTIIGRMKEIDCDITPGVTVVDGHGRTVDTGKGGWDHLIT